MGGKRPKRTRKSTGIYEDRYGFSIAIRGKEHRYPLGTPIEHLLKERRRLKDEAGPAISRRGTLRSDCDDHLRTLPDGRARDEQAAMLAHWCDAFGDTSATLSLSAKTIKQQRAAWLSKKRFSQKHLNNMLHALRAVFKTNYPKEPNPAADVPVFTITYGDARAIPRDLILRIIDGMADTAWPVNPQKKTPPPNLAKLRLRVMAETGLSQAMLKLVEHKHLDFARKQCYVSMRIKGRGVVGATLDLLDDAVAAFQALVDAGGLGAFSTRSLAQAWRRAVEREKRAWLAEEARNDHPRPWPLSDDVRAYDLRHSFATEVLIATGDLEATANLLRHANINTTRRYAQHASNARASLAVQALNKARAASKPLP